MRLLLNNWWNLNFRCDVLLISFTEVVGCGPPSRWCQFVKRHLFLPKRLEALLYHFGDCAHHPARFATFAQLALLCLFIILIFPILPIVGTCKITQTLPGRHRHLLQPAFGLSGCQSRDFSCPRVYLLLPDRGLCIFNSPSHHSGISLNIMLNPSLVFFIAYNVRFSWFLSGKLLFRSQAVQCPEGSDSFCCQAALTFIRLVTSLGGPLCRFAIFGHWKWWNVLFRSIDPCLWWLYCWTRCWMLQDMDNMEASCVF